MGSELSCPCSGRNALDAIETQPSNNDILQEVSKGKLQPEDIILDYVYDQTKISLIEPSQLEGYFSNRALLKVNSISKEINYYYNIAFIANFLPKTDLIFILQQYTPGLEDKSFKLSGNMSPIKYQPGASPKRKSSRYVNSNNSDYSANYKIEMLNLVSNEKKRVIEQILNDLNSKIKRNFVFIGIVNDSMRNFKILYKKSLKKESALTAYEVATYEGILEEDVIYSILSESKYRYKKLVSIMVDCFSENKNKKTYYFIFQDNPEDELTETDHLVIKMEKGNNPNEMYVQDLAKKLNDFQGNYKLDCIVSEEKIIFLILSVPLETLENETPGDFHL
jgi:hypothetical protein